MEITGYHVYILEKCHGYRLKVKVKVTKNMKITVWAIDFELNVVQTFWCRSGWLYVVLYMKRGFRCDVWHTILVSHDVIYDAFYEMVNFVWINSRFGKMEYWCLTWITTVNYVVIGALTLMWWLSDCRFMSPLWVMGIFEISSYHILETRFYTHYISYIQASYLIIMSYVECDIERSNVNYQIQNNAENHFLYQSSPFLKIFRCN